MGTITTYIAYHATDRKNVSSILENNFTYVKKDTHWLGNGVYFFLDKSLAIQWGNNCPTRKYGFINSPAIIEVKVSLDDDYVCDMRELANYNQVKQAFDVFWESFHKASGIITYDKAFYEKLECAFFNWLTQKLNLKCIICSFTKRSMPIIESMTSQVFSNFHLVYTEMQMCVKDVSCITERRVIP